jgi:uncharacterized protein YfkK (UPF0435 family)
MRQGEAMTRDVKDDCASYSVTHDAAAFLERVEHLRKNSGFCIGDIVNTLSHYDSKPILNNNGITIRYVVTKIEENGFVVGKQLTANGYGKNKLLNFNNSLVLDNEYLMAKIVGQEGEIDYREDMKNRKKEIDRLKSLNKTIEVDRGNFEAMKTMVENIKQTKKLYRGYIKNLSFYEVDVIDIDVYDLVKSRESVVSMLRAKGARYEAQSVQESNDKVTLIVYTYNNSYNKLDTAYYFFKGDNTDYCSISDKPFVSMMRDI